MGFKINGKRWRYADTYDMKAFFGMRYEEKWPDQGLPPIEVAGTDSKGNPVPITVFVYSKASAKFLRPKSRKARRAFAKCPDCDALVCAGHTIQHKCRYDCGEVTLVAK